MLAFDRASQSDLTTRNPHRIRVIGVGGAGVNMLDRLKLNHIDGLDLTVANTDQRALQASVVEDRLQLGRELTMGLGAGGDPEVGRQATEASLADLKLRVEERDLVFLCGGLGGGTGSGSLAAIARLARAAGAFVVAFVTMPFSFEGRRRVQQAEAGLAELQRHCHALLTFQNNRMSELIKAEDGIHSAFASVDQLISSAIASIAGMVSRPGLIRLGLDDLIAALADNRCDTLFGWGEARGDKRAADVVRELLKSPLLDKNKLLRQARTVLVHVCGGSDLSLFEVEQVMQELSKQLHPDAHLLFGTAVDPKRDGLSLTVISSLAEETMLPLARETAEESKATPLTTVSVRRAPAAAPVASEPVRQAQALPEPGPVLELDDEAEASFQAPAEPAAQAAAEPDREFEEEGEDLPPPESEPEPAEEFFTDRAEPGEAPLPEPEPEPEPEAQPEPVVQPPPAPVARAVSAPPVPRVAPREIRGTVAAAPQAELEGPPPVVPPAPSPRAAAPPPRALQAPPLRTATAPEPPAAPRPVERQAERPAERGVERPLERAAAESRPQRRPNEADLFEGGGNPRGRFSDSDPTIENGEDLDLPTFLRRKR